MKHAYWGASFDDNQIFDCKILSLPFYDKEKKLPRE